MSGDVAVVVPILNEADSLPQLLVALKAQTERPREIIFSDAGSTDGSPALIESWWRDAQWQGATCKVLSIPGAMPGAGRNAGVRVAKSEWIAFIDAGIEPEPAWLERLWHCARERHSLAVFGVCQFSAEGVLERAVCALSQGQGSVHSVVPASLFNRKVFEDVGYFPEHLRAAEDLSWSKRLVERYGQRVVCQNAIVHYTHFPSGWGRAIRKWKLAEYQSVLAGVRSPQQRLSLLGLPLIYGALFSGTSVGGGVFLLYLFIRGVIDPLRRSKEYPWWGRHPGALLIAPGVAAVLDLAKLAGIIQAYLNSVLSFAKTRVC